MGRSRARAFWQKKSTPSLGNELSRNPDLRALNEAEKAEILGVLPPVDACHVLELGAGTGRYTGEFASRAASVTAVDISAESTATNRLRNEGHDNIVYDVGDVTELDLGRALYDLVFVNWLLIYLDDDDVQYVLQQSLRALRENGRLFVHESCRPRRGSSVVGLPVIRLAHGAPVLFEAGRWWQRLLTAWSHAPLCYFRTPGVYLKWLADCAEVEQSGHLTTYEAAFSSVQQHYWLARKCPQPATAEPVGDSLLAARGQWQFGAGTWRTFDQHVRRSIPFYDALHELVVLIAEERVRPGGVIAELGCSTGNLTYRLSQALPAVTVQGYDAEPGMVAKAQTRQTPNLAYFCADIRDVVLPETDLAILCYTLQFLPVSDRLPLLGRLHQLLTGQGLLILAEKVCQSDPEQEAFTRRLLHRFKREQGFSQKEIDAKDASLEGVLTPLTENANVALLKQAGFRRVWPIFRNTQFVAWVALK